MFSSGSPSVSPQKTTLHTILSWLVIVAASVGLASAAAFKRESITQLLPGQVSAAAPFTHFAGAADSDRCDPSLTQSWRCFVFSYPEKFPTRTLLLTAPRGSALISYHLVHCRGNPSFETVASGRDGNGTQYCAHVDTMIVCALNAQTGSTRYVDYDLDRDHATAMVAHQGTNCTRYQPRHFDR